MQINAPCSWILGMDNMFNPVLTIYFNQVLSWFKKKTNFNFNDCLVAKLADF